MVKCSLFSHFVTSLQSNCCGNKVNVMLRNVKPCSVIGKVYPIQIIGQGHQKKT